MTEKLITVCCLCTQIKNDDATWGPEVMTKEDQFNREDLSHGFCTPCQYEHYPEIMERIDAKKNTPC